MKLGLRIVVSVGLLALIFAFLPWSMVMTAVARLHWWQWSAVVLMFVVGHAVGTIKWRGFVIAGRAALNMRDAAQCYAAGLFANLCLPSIAGGDVLRMLMAGRCTKRPEAAFLGGLMDRITDTTSLAILAGVGAVAVGNTESGAFGRAIGITLSVGMVAGVIALLIMGRVTLRRWPAKLRRPIGRSLVGFRHLRRQPSVAITGLTLSLLIQGSFVILNAELGRAIGVTPSLAVWFLVWPLAKVVSLLPISLGGLAVREASLATLLAPFGVPLAMGVTVSLLWQSVLIVGGLIGGLVWLLLARSRPIPTPPLFARTSKVATQAHA
ncbi:MAG: flippase-like domain-containing protein [Gemmatimonadaceae bacterium]|nr:flippase-like domain-containing protein [Gemmatimonadaceae bacterium]